MKYSHEYEYVRVFLHPGIKRRIVFMLQPEIKSMFWNAFAISSTKTIVFTI
jgi:hypothetical protein